MDKAKKAKLLELRQKKTADRQKLETQRHADFLKAVSDLHGLFDETSQKSAQATDLLLEKLSDTSVKDEIAEVKRAINNIPKIDEVSISNLSELIESQKDLDLSEVTNSINELAKSIQEQKLSSITIKNKKAEEYIPTRRVIEKQGRLVFDDKPMEVTVVGGGGGGYIAGVQAPLIRDDNAIAVVNPDGSQLASTGLVPKVFDTIQVTSYNDNNDPLIVVYRTGGAAGTVVATLTITYDGSYNITQVVRT